MKIALQYNPENNTLYHHGTGELEVEDFLHLQSSIQQIDLKPDYKVLADYSEADSNLKYLDIMKLANEKLHFAPKPEKTRLAIVSGNRDHIYGLARMCQNLLDDQCYDVTVFRERQDAEQWLGLHQKFDDGGSNPQE